MGTVVITTAPDFDLNEAGCCNCNACCAAFKVAYRKAFDALDADDEHDLELMFVPAYSSRQEYEATRHMDETMKERAAALWQRLHDKVSWATTPLIHAVRLDDDGDVLAVCSVEADNVPDGWLILSSADWYADAIDTLNDRDIVVEDGVIYPNPAPFDGTP